MNPEPYLSIVIPVYNEERILGESVEDLIARLDASSLWSALPGPAPHPRYEILLSENGSRDRTLALAEELSARHPEVRVLSIGHPNYGAALKAGILAARGTFVVCDEIDLCDVGFHEQALMLLGGRQVDLVIGSKAMSGANDERPFLRRAATRTINLMLRVMVGFHGTDTHGLKAFHRQSLLPTVRKCLVDRDLFASEFVIRAEREGKRVMEIPVHIREKRPPSINLLKRVPNVMKNLIKLTYTIRIRG